MNSDPAGLRELKGARTRPRHHDRVPDAEQPDSLPPTNSNVAPPRDLPVAARTFWLYFAPLLASAKMLTPADRQTLADYCRARYWLQATERRLLAAWRKRKYDVHLIKMLDAQARGWMDKTTDLAGQLGLTAIARTKIAWSGHGQVINPKTRPQSKVAELQERARTLRRPQPVAKEPEAKSS